MLSNRSKGVPVSATLALAAKAGELKRAGKPVISLSIGEPDWDSIESAKLMGKQAIDRNLTKYTPASGILELKEEIVSDFNSTFSCQAKPANTHISPGAKYAIYNALWCLLNPGDKVGFFKPYWVSYPTMASLVNAEWIPLEVDKNLSPDWVELEKEFAAGLKVLLLNSPNNPSGVTYSKKDMFELSKLLEKYPDVFVISDDIYSRLYWGKDDNRGQAPHLLNENPGLANRVLHISGASKSFAMTGWRIGWAIGPVELIKAMGSFQSQTTGCPCSVSQWAVQAAFKTASGEVEKVKNMLQKRSAKAYGLVSEIQGFNAYESNGAFYLWVDISEFLSKINKTAHEFCEGLLNEKSVVIVPGESFGQEGHIRLSIAAGEDLFAEAVSRITDYCRALL